MLLLSIITTTYNRAQTIKRVYNSIKNQSYRNFEWLIWDDGSVDDTEQVIQSIIDENNDFSINYLKADKNRGKHYGVNEMLKHIKGDVVVAIDSDDEFAGDNVFEQMINEYTKLLNEDKKDVFCVVGLCRTQDGQELKYNDTIVDNEEVNFIDEMMINKRKFPSDLFPIMSVEFAKLHYNYPIPPEKMPYFPEGVHYAKIRSQYKMRFVNKIWRIYHVNNFDNLTNKVNPYTSYYRSLYWLNDFFEKYNKYNPSFFSMHVNSLICYYKNCNRTKDDVLKELNSEDLRKKFINTLKNPKAKIKRFIRFSVLLKIKPYAKLFLAYKKKLTKGV